MPIAGYNSGTWGGAEWYIGSDHNASWTTVFMNAGTLQTWNGYMAGYNGVAHVYGCVWDANNGHLLSQTGQNTVAQGPSPVIGGQSWQGPWTLGLWTATSTYQIAPGMYCLPSDSGRQWSVLNDGGPSYWNSYSVTSPPSLVTGGAQPFTGHMGMYVTYAQGGLKTWNGSTFPKHPVKSYDGSAWHQHPLKSWNGSSWIWRAYESERPNAGLWLPPRYAPPPLTSVELPDLRYGQHFVFDLAPTPALPAPRRSPPTSPRSHHHRSSTNGRAAAPRNDRAA